MNENGILRNVALQAAECGLDSDNDPNELHSPETLLHAEPMPCTIRASSNISYDSPKAKTE